MSMVSHYEMVGQLYLVRACWGGGQEAPLQCEVRRPLDFLLHFSHGYLKTLCVPLGLRT